MIESRRIVLLSGPIAVGKSSVAATLVDLGGFRKIRSSLYLAEIASTNSVASDRNGLQKLGDELDEKTDYRWIVDDVAAPALRADKDHCLWLMDSVRKERQVKHFREQFGKQVAHIHLAAPEHLLLSRYNSRLERGEEYIGNTSYQEAIEHPNEISSRLLEGVADLVIDVSIQSKMDVAIEILRFLKLQ